MLEVSRERLKEQNYLLYIYTPFCGTCQLARTMLEKIEEVHQQEIFCEMNASLYPEFMHANQIESVPCLVIKQNNVLAEKIYAFHSIPNIYQYLLQYKPELFSEKS